MTSFIARHPVDLLAIVPYAIGFHPEDSVVLLTFGGAGHESFHARVDLPDEEGDREQVAAMLADVVVRRECRQVGLVLYTEDPEAALAFHEVLVPRLLGAGVDVVDSLRVCGDRFHAADDPGDPGVVFDLDAHAFTAALVVEGRIAYDSREALADSLVGDDEADREEIALAADRFADRLLELGAGEGATAALTAEVRDQARWLQGRIRAYEATVPAEPLTAGDAARVLVLVALGLVREVALGELTRARAATQLEFWRDLTRRAPRDLRAGPASLCAFAAWVNGEGAVSWCALERCFETDPDDPFAQHVACLLESATPPSVWVPIPQQALRAITGADPGPDPDPGKVAS